MTMQGSRDIRSRRDTCQLEVLTGMTEQPLRPQVPDLPPAGNFGRGGSKQSGVSPPRGILAFPQIEQELPSKTRTMRWMNPSSTADE